MHKYKVGVFPGKFLPPHKGHLNAIIQATTQCQKLYVVISDNKSTTTKCCKESKIKEMPLLLRARWLSQELKEFQNIKIVCLDETDIPEYPKGCKQWILLLKQTIPEKFNVIFGGEKEYQNIFMKYIPDIQYIVYDNNREIVNISATNIRQNIYSNWDYIINSAKNHFIKKILITGTESTGKTTFVKYLAKLFNTSYSEEYGRYYSRDYLGGNENIFTEKDFIKIARIQQNQDEDILQKANKLCFFDSDAIITKYYGEIYLKKNIKELDNYIDNTKYDLIFLMSPNVQWVEDGLRFCGNQKQRKKLHKKLKQMYLNYGFSKKIIYEVNQKTYQDRLNSIINICNIIIL